MNATGGNIFDTPGATPGGEHIDELFSGRGFRVERIVSTGQATPAGEWYDQEEREWVVLLSGRAELRFEGEDKPLVLAPGDYVDIPAHRRHRVESTSPDVETVWLAIHYA